MHCLVMLPSWDAPSLIIILAEHRINPQCNLTTSLRRQWLDPQFATDTKQTAANVKLNVSGATSTSIKAVEEL